jgi:hypothetical protein
MWALTLPQVAATLSATLVGYNTFNAAGLRLLKEKMFNAVLVDDQLDGRVRLDRPMRHDECPRTRIKERTSLT